MVKCPVCNKIDLGHGNSYRELLIDGVVTEICSGCYHVAFIKTNLSRMLHAPRKSL